MEELLIIRYYKGETSKEEDIQVEEWIKGSEENSKIAKQLRDISLATDVAEISLKLDVKKALESIHLKMKRKRTHKIQILFRNIQRATAILFIPLLVSWQKDEATEAAKFGCVPGDAHYQDLDGNHSIDGSDYQIIGCGMPKYSLGWNNTVTYKNFTLNAFFQGSFGADKLNFTRGLHLMAARDARQATLAEIKERYIPGVNENAWRGTTSTGVYG